MVHVEQEIFRATVSIEKAFNTELSVLSRNGCHQRLISAGQ